MAPPNLERELSEETTCSICLERMTEPRMLPCQHTFCLECLQSVAKQNNPKTVDCPQCRREYNLPPNRGASGFPENRLMKFLLEKKEQMIPRILRSFSQPAATDTLQKKEVYA